MHCTLETTDAGRFVKVASDGATWIRFGIREDGALPVSDWTPNLTRTDGMNAPTTDAITSHRAAARRALADDDVIRAYDLIRCALQPNRVEAQCALDSMLRFVTAARTRRDDYMAESFRRQHAMRAAWSALDRDDIPGAYDALDMD